MSERGEKCWAVFPESQADVLKRLGSNQSKYTKVTVIEDEIKNIEAQ